MDDGVLASYIRWWCGNLSEEVISCEDLQQIIDMSRIQHPNSTDCQLQYYVAVNTLEWLKRSSAKGNVSSTDTNEVSSREETRGKTKIKVSYNTANDSSKAEDWGEMLDDLINSPDSIGCIVFPVDSGIKATGKVIFGITKDRFETGTPWRKTGIE